MGLWSRIKKSSQKASKEAYKKKVRADKTRRKNRASSSSYDDVRERANSRPRNNRRRSNSDSGNSRRDTSRSTGRGRRESGYTSSRRGSGSVSSNTSSRRGSGSIGSNTSNRPRTRSGAIAPIGGQTKTMSKANERRGGAKRSQERGNPVGALGGYTLTRWLGSAGSALTKAPDNAMKGALENAGRGHKGGQRNAPTKRNDRWTDSNKKNAQKYYEQRKKNEEEKKKIRDDGYKIDVSVWNPKTKQNERKTVEYTNPVAKKGRETSKKISAWEEKTKEKWLEYGTKDMSDEKKHELPKFVDYVPGGKYLGLVSGKKQREDAKKAYDKSLNEAKNEKRLDYVMQVNSLGVEKGFSDNTRVVTDEHPDGITWKELKSELTRKGLADIDKGFDDVRKEYLNSDEYKHIGKFSTKDAGKKSIEMASDLIDYAIPYGGTQFKALGAVEKAITAAKGGKVLTKTTKAGEKVLTKHGGEAAAKLAQNYMKNGKTFDEAIELATRRVLRSDTITNIEKELLANAAQDIAIGTPLDYVKGKKQGLEGDEMRNYMLQNAAMNLVMGGAASGIAGRTGRAGKAALREQAENAIRNGLDVNKPAIESIKAGSFGAREIEKAKNNWQRARDNKALEEITKRHKTAMKEIRQQQADNALVRRNADIVAESGDPKAGHSNNIYDSSKLKAGTHLNAESSKTTKKAVKDLLNYDGIEKRKFQGEGARTFTEAEVKEIDKAVDDISAMIVNGDRGAAEAEARRLAEKYAEVSDMEFIPKDPDVLKAEKNQLASLRDWIWSIKWKMPEGSARTVKEFYEALGGTKKSLGNRVHVVKGKKTTMTPLTGYSGTSTSHAWGIDELYPQMREEYPDLLPDTDNYYEQFKALAGIMQRKAKDIPTHTSTLRDQEWIDGTYELIARDILDAAEENAKNIEADVPVKTEKELTERQKNQKELDSIKNRIETLKKQRERGGRKEYLAELDEDIKALSDRQAELEKQLGKKARTEKGAETESKTKKESKGKKEKPQTILRQSLQEGEPTDKRVIELTAEREKAAAEARGHAKHMKNAREAGRDEAHISEIKAKMDAADARKNQLDDEIQSLNKRNSTVEIDPNDKPVGFHEVEDETAELFKESRPEGSKTPSNAPTHAEAPPNMERNPKPTTRSKVMGSLLDKSETVIRRTTSSLYGIEKAASKAGAKGKKLLNQTTQVYLAKNRVGAWITDTRTSLGRKRTGKGLNSIFEDAGLFGKKNAAKRTDFENYLMYQHAIDRLEAGKPVHMGEDGKSLYTADQYRQFMDDITKDMSETELKELKTFEEDINGYFKDLMQYRVDAGLVSKETAEMLDAKYPHYVPTFRENDEVMDILTIGSDYKASVDQSIRTATGGSAPIEDLYQSMIKTTQETIINSEENVMMNLYAELKGFSPKAIPEGASLDTIADCAISASGSDMGGWRVTFFNNGEPVVMACDKQVALGLKDFNGQDFGTLLRGMNAIATSKAIVKPGAMFKHLITDWNIFFGVRNGARDMQQALVNSKNTRRFITSMPSAYAAIGRELTPGKKGSAFIRLYEANGGKYSSLVKQNAKFVEPGTENIVLKGANKITGAIEDLNGAIELGPRLCEFIGTLNKHADDILKKDGSSLKKLRSEIAEGMYPGKTIKQLTGDELDELEEAFADRIVNLVGKDAVDEATRNAADITLNFSRNGVIGKTLNAGAVPYLNPSIQGLSKTIRLFTEGKADKALLNLGMKLGTFTIAPAVLNECLLANNRDYQNLNTREKDSNFFIPFGDDGKFIKVPKPRENAVLAEPVEYGLRYFFDKAQIGTIEKGEYSGEKMWQMWHSAVENIGPTNPLTDNLFSPLVRLWQNKTWYGGSIDSISDTLAIQSGDKKANEIYDEKTTAIAIEIGNKKIAGKTLSEITHMSPKKIDDFMDSYFGMIYDLGIAPKSEVNNGNPIINQFVKDSVFSNKTGTEMWAQFQKLNDPKTVGGKIIQKGKDAVLGHNKHNINDKTPEAEEWLNQKGYDDMTYSGAILAYETSGDFKPTKAKELIRSTKKLQNAFRHDMVYGDGVVTPAKDPIRKLSKLVGVDYALEKLTYTYVDKETGEEKNQHRDAWRNYKKSGEYKNDPGKNGQRFLNLYTQMRYTNGLIGESKSFPGWMTASVLCATSKGNNDELAKAYIAPDATAKKTAEERQQEYVQRGKNYVEYTGTKGEYIKGQRDLFKGSKKLGNEYMRELQDYDKSMILASKKHRDLQYYAADVGGYTSQRMNPARCLVANGHTTKEINKFAKSYKLDVDKSGWTGDDWKAYKSKVAAAVQKEYANESAEIQAAAYHVIVGDDWSSPFGEIGDYGRKDDTGVTKLDEQDDYDGRRGGRRGRRGRRRRGRRGGSGGSGSGGGTVPKTASGAINVTVSDPFSGFKDVGGKRGGKVSNHSSKSNLNDAYRKRARKLRDSMS